MPKVPMYERQVGPNTQTGFRYSQIADASSFGAAQADQMGQLGQAVTQAGKAVFDYAAASEERKNKALARQTLIDFEDEAMGYMSEVHKLQGQDALDVHANVTKKMDELKKKYSSNLQNDRQRELFTSSFDDSAQRYKNTALNFQEKQRESFEITTLDAQNKTSIEKAIAQRYDPAAIAEAEGIIKQNTAYKYRGYGEAKDKAITDGVSALHKEVLASVSADSPARGQEYLLANWEKFNPSIRSELKAQIDKMVDSEWVVNTANTLAASGASIEAQLKEVEKIKDTEKQSKVRSLVWDRQKEKEMIADLNNKRILEAEVDKVFKDPAGYKVPLALREKEQRDLYALQKQLKNDMLGGAVKSDMNLYHELSTMPQDQLRSVNLLTYAERLKPEDLKALIKRQTDNDEGFTPHKQLEIAIKGMEQFDPKEGGEEANTRKNNLIAEFKAEYDRLPQKEKTPQKVNEIIQDLLKPATIKTGWFDRLKDKTIFRFEVPYLEATYKSLYDTQAASANLPETLKGSGAKYFAETQEYYVDNDEMRKIFDRNGKLLRVYKLQKRQAGK